MWGGGDIAIGNVHDQIFMLTYNKLFKMKFDFNFSCWKWQCTNNPPQKKKKKKKCQLGAQKLYYGNYAFKNTYIFKELMNVWLMILH